MDYYISCKRKGILLPDDSMSSNKMEFFELTVHFSVSEEVQRIVDCKTMDGILTLSLTFSSVYDEFMFFMLILKNQNRILVPNRFAPKFSKRDVMFRNE